MELSKHCPGVSTLKQFVKLNLKSDHKQVVSGSRYAIKRKLVPRLSNAYFQGVRQTRISNKGPSQRLIGSRTVYFILFQTIIFYINVSLETVHPSADDCRPRLGSADAAVHLIKISNYNSRCILSRTANGIYSYF